MVSSILTNLLVLSRDDYETIRARLEGIGIANLPFTPEADLDFLRSRALIMIEIENSLWIARQMPDYGEGAELAELIVKPRRFRKREKIEQWEEWKKSVQRFCSQLETRRHLKGFLETAKVPTVIIKDEDLSPLLNWEKTYPLGTMIQEPEMSAKFVQDLSRRQSRFIHNQANVLALNVFLCIYPTSAISQDETTLKALLAMLNSLVTKDSLRHVGRSYGSDTVKIEPREMDNLPILNPVKLATNEREELAELFEQLCHIGPEEVEAEKAIRQSTDEKIAAISKIGL